MRKRFGLVLLISGGCLFGILIWTFAHTGRLRSTPAQAIEAPYNTTVYSPTPFISRAKPVIRTETVVIGYTKRGTSISAFKSGHGEKHIIVLAGIHGDEPSSVLVAGEFVASLDSDPVPHETTVVVVPRANPDGLNAGTRTNSAGVDVNRNFPSKTWHAESRASRYYPGEKPSSEPETRALIDIIKKWSPVLMVSIHAPLNCVNWDGPAESISRAMAQASGYSLCENIGYGTPGSLGSYAGQDLNIPVITFELKDARGSPEITNQGVQALRAAVRFMSRASSVD